MHEQRRGIKQTEPDRRLALEATHLRKLAQGTPPGVRREWLLRRARQCEDGLAHQRVAAIPRTAASQMRHSTGQPSPLIAQVKDVLQRARKLPAGPTRNDLRQLAQGLLKLHREGFRANVEILFAAPPK
jgi:hypothetical protein